MPAGAMADPVLDLVQQMLADQNQLLTEVRKSREPVLSQPLRLAQERHRQKPPAPGEIPWPDMAHFLRDVRLCPNGNNWQANERMKRWDMTLTGWNNEISRKAIPSGMNELIGADGGFLVPPEFSNQLLMRIYANDLLSRTTMLPLETSNALDIPAINEQSRADGSRYGGVFANWSGEGETGTESKGSIKKVSLKLNSLRLFIRATDELLQDAAAMALGQYVNIVAPAEMQFRIGDALVNGNGVEKPQGLMNSPSKIAVLAEAGQGAGTIVAANVLKMLARLHLSCWGNAIWLFDQSCIPALSTMTIGTAGAQLAVYQPPGGLSSAPYATILGRPAIPTEFNKQVGTEGDLILTDLSTMLSATKGGLQTAASMHVYFLSAEQVFRFILRMDARSWWLTALTPKSAGDTQSNIVTLATR